ncbi:hypothetical protein [Pseudomonas sp. BGI-2]|uniref:hypothetical protein n=1 Tax=Pseudomonas sp. BGI-2 TaxID=2528211 RepID=UPI0013F461FA|nr:hypothetical protein [Pseudomonas sp. BGI-2]
MTASHQLRASRIAAPLAPTGLLVLPLEMTQRKPSPADWVKLAAEILPGGQHDYPASLLAD